MPDEHSADWRMGYGITLAAVAFGKIDVGAAGFMAGGGEVGAGLVAAPESGGASLVPAAQGAVIMVSSGAVVHSGVLDGIRAASEVVSAMQMRGDGQGGPKVGSAGGPGAGKAFSEKTKNTAEKQADSKCVFCGRETTREPGPTQRNTDHAVAKSRGGNNTLDNAQNTCRQCNLKKNI